MYGVPDFCQTHRTKIKFDTLCQKAEEQNLEAVISLSYTVAFNVVSFDSDLRPDMVSLANGLLLLKSTEKLKIFMELAQVMLLKDLRC